ncbi:hypothetical protein HanIR_Chr03g0126521 [Helianthus annuus]|nr:hypothetical protein HanIR_Chr03g0126521 [Helianthus annuus]
MGSSGFGSIFVGINTHDQLLIKTSDSFSGLLLFAVGSLLFMVAFVKDREFQSFFAKGCVLLHIAMAIWRIYFERKLEELGRDWLRLVVGDFVLAISWYCFLCVVGEKVRLDKHANRFMTRSLFLD